MPKRRQNTSYRVTWGQHQGWSPGEAETSGNHIIVEGKKTFHAQISTGESRKVKHRVYHFIGMKRVAALPGMPGRM